MAKTTAKISKGNRTRKKHKLPLDTFSERPPRGRPFKIKASWVRGRAESYQSTLNVIWDRVAPRLLTAQSREDVVRAFGGETLGGYALEFISLADLILQVVHERRFPKRKSQAQIRFLAESIAAQAVVSPRSSRDICERERARIQRIHRIIRYEYWIECSCGYKGRSFNHACPKCEAEIRLMTESALDASSIYQALSRNT